jgi:CheY-like chemotaxis protein
VDDRALMRELLRCALDELGVATATQVSTGAAAIDAAAEHRPEVVILHETAALGGPEVIERLRSASPDLRVIVLSADRAETPPSLVAAADAVVEEGAGLEDLPSALGVRPARRPRGWVSRTTRGTGPPHGHRQRWLKRLEGAVSASILLVGLVFVLPVLGVDGRLAAAHQSLDALAERLPDATPVEAVTLASTLIAHRAMLVSEDVDVTELDGEIAEQLDPLLPTLTTDVAQALEGVLGHLLVEGPSVSSTVAPTTPAPPTSTAPAPTETPPPTPSQTASPSPDETPSPTPGETRSPSPSETPSPTPTEPVSPTPSETPDPSASPSPAVEGGA